MRPVVVVATRNPGKSREFRELLRDVPVEWRDLQDFPDVPDVPETADSYLGNARAKALSVARRIGVPALADDSGLEVEALDGAPGLHSARFAGEPRSDERNVHKLLTALADVPDSKRRARFRCVLVLAKPNGDMRSVEGVCVGRITREPAGRDGFGYDPVFHYPPSGATFAELPPAEKNRVSHRADACRQLSAIALDFLSR